MSAISRNVAVLLVKETSWSTAVVTRIVKRAYTSTVEDEFTPKNAVILSKMTRYEYERIRNYELDEEELRTHLLDRGTDYYALKKRHERHEEIMKHVEDKLAERNISSQVISRTKYNAECLKGADIVFSAGGDGTFLLGASHIRTPNLPLIGVNTDPERSEGYLCLPRKYSFNFGRALDKILSGKFRWTYRKRIRTTMTGKHANDNPVQLLEQQLEHPEQRFSEHIREHELHHKPSSIVADQPSRVLPILSLNDVFIGESLSARVSYYELSVDDAPAVLQKSSGITICTGTGSSSWHFSINHLQKQDVREILKITQERTGMKIPYDCPDVLTAIHNKFNKTLKFNPSSSKLAYTVRDPIHSGVFQIGDPRGFASRIKIKSKMWDACLVIDGGVSFQFNDGAEATLEILDDDHLQTICLE